MEKTEVVIVHLELACFYADDQVGEHLINQGSERMLGLYINLFIYNLSMKFIWQCICSMRFICFKLYKQSHLATYYSTLRQ
jgi:hypothetical protein